jgi:hypothetical protein
MGCKRWQGAIILRSMDPLTFDPNIADNLAVEGNEPPASQAEAQGPPQPKSPIESAKTPDPTQHGQFIKPYIKGELSTSAGQVKKKEKSAFTVLPGVKTHSGRDIIRVKLQSGEIQPFYQSSGSNSGKPGSWLPFSGLGMQHGKTWFDKAFSTGGKLRDPKHPLHRYGTEELKNVSQQLEGMSFPLPEGTVRGGTGIYGPPEHPAAEINQWLGTEKALAWHGTFNSLIKQELLDPKEYYGKNIPKDIPAARPQGDNLAAAQEAEQDKAERARQSRERAAQTKTVTPPIVPPKNPPANVASAAEFPEPNRQPEPLPTTKTQQPQPVVAETPPPVAQPQETVTPPMGVPMGVPMAKEMPQVVAKKQETVNPPEAKHYPPEAIPVASHYPPEAIPVASHYPPVAAFAPKEEPPVADFASPDPVPASVAPTAEPVIAPVIATGGGGDSGKKPPVVTTAAPMPEGEGEPKKEAKATETKKPPVKPTSGAQKLSKQDIKDLRKRGLDEVTLQNMINAGMVEIEEPLATEEDKGPSASARAARKYRRKMELREESRKLDPEVDAYWKRREAMEAAGSTADTSEPAEDIAERLRKRDEKKREVYETRRDPSSTKGYDPEFDKTEKAKESEKADRIQRKKDREDEVAYRKWLADMREKQRTTAKQERREEKDARDAQRAYEQTAEGRAQKRLQDKRKEKELDTERRNLASPGYDREYDREQHRKVMRDKDTGLFGRLGETYSYYSRQGQRVAEKVFGKPRTPEVTAEPPKPVVPPEPVYTRVPGPRRIPPPPPAPIEPPETPAPPTLTAAADGGTVPPAPPVMPPAMPAPAGGTPPPRPPIPVAAAAESAAAPGAAEAAGSAVAVGAVVGVVAVVLEAIKETIDKAAQIGAKTADFGATGLRGETRQTMQGVADSTKVEGAAAYTAIGMLGNAASTSGNALLRLHDAVGDTVEKLSMYNGLLAASVAREEVRVINRDISRAERFGPELEGMQNQRISINTKWDRIIDALYPIFMRIGSVGLTLLENLVDLVKNGLKTIFEALDTIVVFLGHLDIAGTGAVLNSISVTIQRILAIMRERDDEVGDNELMRNVLAMRTVFNAVVPAPVNPTVRGTAGPTFGVP